MSYSLKHGVNLSRRACRNRFRFPWIYPCLLLLLLNRYEIVDAETTAGVPPRPIEPLDRTTSRGHSVTPDPDLLANRFDTYPGLQFGPMGPKDRSAFISDNRPAPELRTSTGRSYENGAGMSSTESDHVRQPHSADSLPHSAIIINGHNGATGTENMARETPSADSASSTEGTTTSTVEVTQKKIKRYPVAAVEFTRVETPFIIGLWIFCASLAKIGFHMAPQLNKIFPESCLLIVVGVVIGVLLFHTTDSVHVSPLTPDTFFLYMLPPIILDAGYFMPNRLFFDHLGTILVFAVVGTVFNTMTIGASLWACGQTGLFNCETPILDMFLFAALISAVDPVAVLAVFEEIHVNEILYIVVFGESLLNDAVTVVLYHMFEGYSEMGPDNIIYTDVLAGFASFFVVAIGGTVIGVIWGFATGFVTRFTHEVRVIEPIFIFVMAYLAYLNAEIFHMSGILAITFCGITMKNYVEANISHKSHTTVKYAMKMLSSSSETIIFMFLGVATVNSNHDWNTWFVFLTIIFCSVYRTLGVIILTYIVNRFRLNKLSKVEKFVMSYGGLRGAVAFALVLLIDPSHVPLQPMFMTTTIAVIYFTVFVQGITIKPLVTILNVKRAEKRKPTMNERIHERFMDHLMAGIEEIIGKHGNYHVRDKFKRFDNKYIRPYLLRNYQGAEPKILETYSKLAMKDAMEYMRRNASTIGNISGTESMSAIFRNYTAGNLNGSPSFSQLDSSTWNIDMQELEYNPSKKDLTDAKIHHLLAEELWKPYRRHRRLSYSRHAVNDRDLSTQVNYRTHMNIRRLVGERKHHHKRSKKLNKDGKQNHVSFPDFQQNGSAKQFTHDYINEVLHENEDESRQIKEDWDSPITFTAKSSPSDEPPLSTGTECSGSLLSQAPLIGGNDNRPTRFPTAAEISLPWRRDRSNYNVTEDSMYGEAAKRMSRESDGGDVVRVTTPTATETMLPWKRDDDNEEATAVVQQNEFPAWASNKEYLAYNSPSATFLGGIENTKQPSIIGLFRRESTGSAHGSSCDSSPRTERTGGGQAVLLIEDGSGTSDPLGVLQRPGAPMPTTPNPRRQVRRGSMLELGGAQQTISKSLNRYRSLTCDSIPEELPPKLPPPEQWRGRYTPRPPIRRQRTIGTSLLSSSSSDTSVDEDNEEDNILVNI